MAEGAVFPEPPLGGGLVVDVEVEAAVVVVLEAAVFFLFEPLDSHTASPTTTAAMITKVMPRRRFCLRLARFFSASRRAWRAAFCR